MTDEAHNEKPILVDSLFDTPGLADALESHQFRHFLDQVPIAIVVSELKDGERIAYANPEFEKLSGQLAADVEGNPWDILEGRPASEGASGKLGDAIANSSDFVGTFTVGFDGEKKSVDAYSNIIEDDNGISVYRLAALVDVSAHDPVNENELSRQLLSKDALLQEIQHRVKNNLQMITALIRIEARNARGPGDPSAFARLVGRIESIGLLYKLLSDDGSSGEIDLGVYLSAVASSVMQAHATEGIRLDLMIDSYLVSVNVAMPTGLVVNELLTNALKHAFVGRETGLITLRCIVDTEGCRVVVADDGIGFPPGTDWPKRGKLSALIVRSLRENANAEIEVESNAGSGTRTVI